MFKPIRLLILCMSVLVSTGALAQSQPTFSPGQDPKPAGKKWEKIDNMSDEFNGSSLNTSKWDNQDPQWKGRAPALFSVNAVSVGGGDLKIEADDNLTQQEKNQNPGFTHQGGLVRSINKATYGYYETRMKANKTCLSSTFWLFNKRNEFTGCDERTTELDVTENVGINAYRDDPSKNWINQIITTINSNTHSRGVVGNPGCGIPVGQNGDKSPIGEEAWRDYHVYGVWWKNATELIFFLDGNEVHRITPPADFDLGMYLRMVVESYDWNKPRAGWDGMNESLANRTTYYDWTRSWRLVDDPNGGGGTADVNCNSLPNSVATGTTITASVDYTADQQRDVVIELWNTTTNSWLAEGRTTVNAGSGTASVNISVSPAPATGSNYQFKASIRPVGGNWTTNLDACNKSGISLTSGGGNGGGGGGSCDVPWSSPNQSITQTTVNWTSPSIDISCASAVNIS
ncbi:MAG: family 16 glycosylhydrolase, partial [Bacteroidota bacterium]